MPRIQSNQPGMSRPHDIRSAIPKIDINDPAAFPQYVKREYPKMLTYVDAKGKRHPVVDEDTQSPYLFDSDEDVSEFLDTMEDQDRARNIRENDPDAQTAAVMERNNELLRKSADAISAKDKRIAELEALLAQGKMPLRAETSAATGKTGKAKAAKAKAKPVALKALPAGGKTK